MLGAFLSEKARLTVVTSDWARERAEIVFGLLFPGRNPDFATVSGDLPPLQEAQRRDQEALVNHTLYWPSINRYSLDSPNRLGM